MGSCISIRTELIEKPNTCWSSTNIQLDSSLGYIDFELKEIFKKKITYRIIIYFYLIKEYIIKNIFPSDQCLIVCALRFRL